MKQTQITAEDVKNELLRLRSENEKLKEENRGLKKVNIQFVKRNMEIVKENEFYRAKCEILEFEPKKG